MMPPRTPQQRAVTQLRSAMPGALGGRVRSAQQVRPRPSGLVRLAPVAPAPTPYRDEVMADSPALYWRLGESSGIVAADASGNSRTGQYSSLVNLGAPPLIQDGDTDTAATFTGGYVERAREAWMDVSTITLEAVVNANTIAGDHRMIWSRDNTVDATWRSFQFRVKPTGELELITFAAGPTAKVLASAAGTIVTGTTYHLAAVITPTLCTLYVNGVSVASSSTMGTMIGSNAGLRLGAAGVSAVHPFLGVMDEGAVYLSALSAARIAAHAAVAA